MNLTNYHSHTLYCDGRAGMEDFIRFAISQGFTSYGIFRMLRSRSLLIGRWSGIVWTTIWLSLPG